MNYDALLLNASSEILLLLDTQTLQIVAASDAASRQLGYPAEALIGMPIGELECSLSDLFFWEEMASSESAMEAQSSYRRKDGSVFEVRKFAKRIAEFIGERNEYYQLRVRLARKERAAPEVNITGLHLAATLEATDDGILLTDNEGSILNMNRRFSNLMGLPEHLLAERDDHGIVAFIESLLLKNPGASDGPTQLSQVIDLRLDLGADTFETLYLTDGRVLECVSHPARDRDRTIGRVFCYRDITQRVKHEQFLQEARDIAEQATLSKGQFLANMSHEIRTPMNAILGMLKLMHATDLDARQFDYVDKAEGAAQSLLGLLNDILDFSKIEAGKLELDPQHFAIERVLRELSVILAANLGNKPVELLYDVDPALPATLVGDAMRLQQVLINLGGNALKFTPDGEVILYLRALENKPSSTRLRIGVRDTGIGIATENQAKVFGDFSQAESSTTRRYGGTGLGLSICKRLVALMGGELKLDSALGHGSDFHFEIELPHSGSTDSTDAAGSAGVSGPAELPHSPPISSAGLDVLVIDDNARARGLFSQMMQVLGWRAQLAASGAEALALVRARAAAGQAAFEAIFVDWEMPGMDGWQTLSELRQTGGAFGSPVCIMVASHNRQALAQRSAQEQATLNAFLVKPVTAAMLREVVLDAKAGNTNFRRRERQSTKSEPRLNGMRLLVVEDNMVNQQVARELLKAEGAEVDLADNGLAAVTLLSGMRDAVVYDAVLMDVQMPVMDGFTATRALRNEHGLTQLPIIAMTANAMASDREECLHAGMNDHVGKPFDLDYLVKVLLQTTDFRPRTSAPTAMVEVHVDVETALRQIDGMTDLYLDLVRQFVTELGQVVGDYSGALHSGRVADAARMMHTLKGTSATLGVKALSALALQLEQLCKKGSGTPDASETMVAGVITEALAREKELADTVQASIVALEHAAQKLAAQR